jgi:hypothetical protein
MKQTTILRLSWISSGMACLIIAFAIVYLVALGFKSGNAGFRGLMGVALIFMEGGALLGLTYSQRLWVNRPEKQRRLRVAKLLVIVSILVAIPLYPYWFFATKP